MARLAIIGGGASGLMAAHRLQSDHQITVFEKDAILGGNVRTLNGNVTTDSLPRTLRLECGVLGFHKTSSPVLHALLDELGIALQESQPSSSLYHRKGYFPSRPGDYLNRSVLAALLRMPGYAAQIWRLRSDYAAGFRAISRYKGRDDMAVGELLGTNPVLDDFLRSLLSLAYSTPFPDTDRLPVQLVAPYLRSLRHPDWSYVKNGVSTYLTRIADRGTFDVVTNAGHVRLRRIPRGIEVQARGQSLTADAAILATTPGQVLNIVTDADELEQNWFGAWSDREFETVVHRDEAFYTPYRATHRTPMDLFVDGGTDTYGYNTALNQFCGLPEHPPYSFAYGLDQKIAPEKQLYSCRHTVPVYTPEALRSRDHLIANMGRRGLFFAGAWLNNGLHEGAAVSAQQVADRVRASGLDQETPLAAAG